MSNSATYECEKCGKSHVIADSGRKKEIPVYCCGMETKRTTRNSFARKKTNRKTKSRTR